MPDPSDAELLTSWQKLDSETAFRMLVERYAGLVYKAALRTGGNETLAAEASQLTFITLARKAGTLSERGCLAGWLHVTAMMQAKNLLQHRVRENRKLEKLGLHLEIMAGNPTLSTWSKLEPVLDEALAALSKGDRETILLRHYRALSIREIAANFSISADAAQKRVDRAMERLRTQLFRRGHPTEITLSTALLAGLAADAEAGAPLAASFATRALSAGPCTGSFLSTLLLLFTVKKIAIAVSVLALLFTTAALLQPGKASSTRAASSTAATQPSKKATGDPIPGTKPTTISAIKEATRRLTEKYGADRTNQSRAAAETCIAQSSKSNAFLGSMFGLMKGSFSLENLPMAIREELALSEEQKNAADAISRNFMARQIAGKKSDLEKLASNPTPLMELLLAADACSREEITREEYLSIRATVGEQVKAVDDPVDSNSRSVNFETMDTAQCEPTFIREFRAILTDPRQLDLFDREVQTAANPETGYQNKSSFAFLEPTDLALLAKKMGATLKLVSGAADQSDAEAELKAKGIDFQAE